MICLKELLRVEELRVNLKSGRELIKSINFDLYENEILGLVGESGSGKSISSQALLRLLDPSLFTIDGRIFFRNENILELREKDMSKLRGKKISMIYQDPQMAMNPLMTIYDQVEEPLLVHGNYSRSERQFKVRDILGRVRLDNLDQILNKYPHELSGGQLQRIMIAMALITEPDILIADEPTTALDLTIQKEIVELIEDLARQMKMSVIFIAHDLGLIAEIATRVLVMYKGEIIEEARVLEFFDRPKTEYSKSLLAVRPRFLYREVD